MGRGLSKQTILTREFGRPMDVRREASSCSQKACGTRGLIGQNPDNPRLAILIAYNHVTVRFHEPKPCMNPAVIGGLSEERQKFFQDVWILGNDRGKK